MKDQQFTEEKPLLPESRGQETEMVSVSVCVCAWLNIVYKWPPVFWQENKKNGCVCVHDKGFIYAHQIPHFILIHTSVLS